MAKIFAFCCFYMQHNHVLNKLNLTFNPTTKVEWGREKVCRQNICCHVFESI